MQKTYQTSQLRVKEVRKFRYIDLGMFLSLLLNVTYLVSWGKGDAWYFLLLCIAPAHHNYFLNLNPFTIKYCVLYRVLCNFQIFSYTGRYYVLTLSCPYAQHKVVWRGGRKAPLILNLGTGLRWMDGFTLLPFYSPPREIALITHWRGSCVEHEASLDASEKWQVSCFCQTFNHNSLVVQAVA
jgi:hypothetical protein